MILNLLILCNPNNDKLKEHRSIAYVSIFTVFDIILPQSFTVNPTSSDVPVEKRRDKFILKH